MLQLLAQLLPPRLRLPEVVHDEQVPLLAHKTARLDLRGVEEQEAVGEKLVKSLVQKQQLPHNPDLLLWIHIWKRAKSACEGELFRMPAPVCLKLLIFTQPKVHFHKMRGRNKKISTTKCTFESKQYLGNVPRVSNADKGSKVSLRLVQSVQKLV